MAVTLCGHEDHLENYRKEAERLLLWSVAEMGKPLSSLTHEDCLRYQQFLANRNPLPHG